MDLEKLLPVLCEAEMRELRLLRALSAECRTVAEFGVHDCTSTWWLLAGMPRRLTSYDIGSTSHPYPGNIGAVESEVARVAQAAGELGLEYRFILGSSLEIVLEETDLLFIDTCHTYAQLKRELELHAAKVWKFLVFHDTTVFADRDEGGRLPGIWPAIAEFMATHPEWQLKERLTNFNGLTVLERRP